ncbi:hypothetical protein GOODEAATRI_018055, partial [Goodea atripinnis]
DEEDGGGRGVLTAVCDHLALQDVDELLRRLDADLEGRVTVRQFSKALWSSAPTLSSTPVRSADLQRALHRNQQLVKEEGPARSASPSLLLATVGQRVLSRLDDGSGCTSPERVVALWTEEGIRNSQEILQTLDFPLEERLSLADLTLVLDNELLVSGNGIHQAALISYKTEIQHLQEVAEQACRERDKLRTDLDLAQHRNLQLVREVDDRHASMETLNESKIRSDCCWGFGNHVLLCSQEKQHLEDELNAVKMKLSEAESSVERLQRDLDQLLHHKDRNDELSSELELLKSHRSSRKSHLPAGGDVSELSWSQQHSALSSLDLSGPSVSIHTELALQQLKENHEQELQQLQIQLETQVPGCGRIHDLTWSPNTSCLVRKAHQGLYFLQKLRNPGHGSPEELLPRIQWERAELEQNYAREISNLVQRLSGEKDQLEAEMKLKMDQEVMRVRWVGQNQNQVNVSWFLIGLKLEESITYLESQEVRNKRLASEKGSLEGELQQVRKKEAELLDQMDQLKAELTDRSYSSTLQTVTFLRSELEKLQAALGSRTESISRLTTDLDSLKMDRDRLIQDLKEQAMAVDTLQLQLDAVSEELDQRKRSEAALQEALQEEQNRASELQSSLTEEKEEVTYLSQENSTYMRLVDQLSTQIVEMEEEISSLREHLRGLSLQLNDTADLVLDLRRQLNSRTSQVERLQSEAVDRTSEQVLFLQRALQDSQNQLTSTQEDFDREKRRLAQRLMELENLVLDLEDVTEAASPHRTQLEEVRSENAALQERLKVLQQEVQNLEDEAEKKSSRNLKLSSDNGDLSNRLCGEQESVRMLQERLATVSKEQEEGAVAEADLLRFQLLVATQEKLGHAQEVTELHRKLREALSKDVRVQKLSQEHQNLRSRLDKVETARTQAHDQVRIRIRTKIQRDRGGVKTRRDENKLDNRDKVQEFKEQVSLCFCGHQTAGRSLLLTLGFVQMEKNKKMSSMLKDLYVENSQLMKALQVTEQRQKQAEKKNFMLEEKVGVLNELLKEVVATVLAT